jgi:hypothetical protein
VKGSCEHGIDPSGSIKCWEVLEGLHNWRLLRTRHAVVKRGPPNMGIISTVF